jgi:hypothetical protein
MPVLIPADEERLERLRAARASVRYFQHNLERLQKLGYRHLALCDGQVVGRGNTPEEAEREAERAGTPRDRWILVYVPQPGESYFY